MYRYKQPRITSILLQNTQRPGGESMEEKIRRVMNNNEPIDAISERIYTERKDGVLPEYDIRTDRWEVALEGMDLITKTNIAKREERMKGIGEQAKEGMEKEGNKKGDIGGPESIEGTNPTK